MNDLKFYVRGLIKGDGQFKQTAFLPRKLIAITGAHGFRVKRSLSGKRGFSYSRSLHPGRGPQFKAVARPKRPEGERGRQAALSGRTTAGLEPMEWLVMDVHHINCFTSRGPMGTYFQPKRLDRISRYRDY